MEKTYLGKTVRELERALARLAPGQGRIKRRNARALVRAKCRRILDAVDNDYPAIRKEIVGRKKLTPRERAERMRKAGWAVAKNEDLRLYTNANVRMKSAVTLDSGSAHYIQTWVPLWAAQIAFNYEYDVALKKLGRMVRDKMYREAELALLQLQKV